MSVITLEKVFSDLRVGELVHLNGKDNRKSQTSEDAVNESILSSINMGLTDLYTRFPLLESEVVVQLYPHIASYTLSSDFARSNQESTETYKYILDSPYAPFKDNVLRIESVLDELGNELGINNPLADYSVFISDYRSIQVPFAEQEIALFIGYRANHPTIEKTALLAPEQITVNVPAYLYEALLKYVAYRHHSNRPTQESRAESLKNLQLYTAICDRVDRLNITNNGLTYNTNVLDVNGWV